MARIYVVVAESSRARIYLVEGKTGPWVELETLSHPASRLHEGTLVSDGPGQGFDSRAGGGTGQHALAGHEASAHHHEVEAFAKELAARLESARQADHFDQLVLVAPPVFLGELRRHLSPSTSRLVEREVGKNLVREDSASLHDHIF